MPHNYHRIPGGWVSTFFRGEIHPKVFASRWEIEIPDIPLKEGEVVVVMENVTVIKSSGKDQRKVRVRRLSQEDLDYLYDPNRSNVSFEIVKTRPGFLTFKHVVKFRGIEVISETIEVSKDELRLIDNWLKVNLNSVGGGVCYYKNFFIQTSEAISREILEVVFGFNVEAEKEALRQIQEASRLKKEEDLKIEHARRVKIFFEFNPEAVSWFSALPLWEEICQEMFVRRLTVRVESVKLVYWERAEEVWTHWHSFKIGDEEFKFPAETTIVDCRFI